MSSLIRRYSLPHSSLPLMFPPHRGNVLMTLASDNDAMKALQRGLK
jgi:hypothetical protein